MEVPSPSSSQALESNGCFSNKGHNEEEENGDISSVDSVSTHSNAAVQKSPSKAHAELCSIPNLTCKSSNNLGGGILKKNKRVARAVPGSGSSSTSQQRGLRVAGKRRNPKVFIGGGRFHHDENDLDAFALPLGMSIAAVVALVLEGKNVADEKISADHLSLVWGDRFDCFVRNFEKSFRCTLSTLRLVNRASLNEGGNSLGHSNVECYNSEGVQSTSPNEQGHPSRESDINSHSEAVPTSYGSHRLFNSVEEMRHMRSDSVNQELTVHGQINQHFACVSPSTMGSGLNNSMLRTLEKSVIEHARSNDLKEFEIGLRMKGLQLKDSQLALKSSSNYLERLKLSLSISKASFKVEKFINQLEDTRHAALLKKCIDCLVAGLFIMSVSLLYGAYIYSYERIMEVTTSCITPPKESKSWWIPNPVTSFNSGLNVVKCHVIAVSRLLFCVFMILAIAYLLLQRPVTSKQTMPVTFILLLLGVVCGFAGKLCVDTLGGNGYIWLLYWETLCLLHLFANVCTSALFSILHGPVSVSQEVKAKLRLLYWVRRLAFYTMALFLLPLFCGLMPFAGIGDWKDHFLLLATDALFKSTVVVGS